MREVARELRSHGMPLHETAARVGWVYGQEVTAGQIARWELADTQLERDAAMAAEYLA